MFGKVKRWLGIEGVKLELEIPETISSDAAELTGTIRIFSMHSQTVTKVKVMMIEKYTRGRRKGKLVDEYQLGSIELNDEIEIPAQEHREVDFVLPISIPKSEMDEFEEKNLVFRGIAKTAKFIKGAKSVFRVEVEAVVKGTALNPFDTQEIRLMR